MMIRLTAASSPEATTHNAIHLVAAAIEAVEAHRVGSRITCSSGTQYHVRQTPRDVMRLLEAAAAGE